MKYRVEESSTEPWPYVIIGPNGAVVGDGFDVREDAEGICLGLNAAYKQGWIDAGGSGEAARTNE